MSKRNDTLSQGKCQDVSVEAETGIVPLPPMELTPQELLERGRKAKELWNTYKQLVSELRGEGDFVKIPFRDKKTAEIRWVEAPTRQWVLKLVRIFALQVETEILSTSEGIFIVRAVVSDRTGRRVSDQGACSVVEMEARLREKEKATAFALATATTRAVNRAVIDFVGIKQITAEEVSTAVAVAPTSPEEIEGEPIFELEPPSEAEPEGMKRYALLSEIFQLAEEIYGDRGEKIVYQTAEKHFGTAELKSLSVPQLQALLKAFRKKAQPTAEEKPQGGGEVGKAIFEEGGV